MSPAPQGLRELAWGAGIATEYHDVDGHLHRTAVPVLQALLAAVGLPAGDEAAVAGSHRSLHRRHWETLVAPTTVCWEGDTPAVEVRRRSSAADRPIDISIELEGGVTLPLILGSEVLVEAGAAEVDGRSRVAHRVPLGHLPLGAHRVVVEADGRRQAGHVLVAPRLAPALTRGWGVFAPVYALRRSSHEGVYHQGAGHLGDLGALADWVATLGGDLVGTLPLLATFDGDASPYAPVSRLAWNERHLDLAALPEAAAIDLAALESTSGGGESVRNPIAPAPTSADGGDDLVDWPSEVARVRTALAAMVAGLGDARRGELDAFTAAHPHVDELAAWQAEVDRAGAPSPGDPLRHADHDPDTVLRHRYAQWAMEAQLAELAGRLGGRGQSLYLDLPLGVHGAGFDVWRSPGLFAGGVSVGAPPDEFFTGGQDWGFPPLLPEASRADGHAYLRASLAHQLRHAGVVRFDHVMALHRLWWVPAGAPATEGAYVHYPADELAAILTLEAWRAGAVVVGENLGTVPPAVNDLLAEHRLLGMYATQFELGAAPHARWAPAATMAVVNTHDMDPFAAFWAGAGDDWRARIVEQLTADGQAPATDAALDVLEALLGWLGRSDAASVVVTLEDLWGEARRQNRPGTGPEEPNWRRRMARTLDEIADDPAIAARLDRLVAARGVGEGG